MIPVKKIRLIAFLAYGIVLYAIAFLFSQDFVGEGFWASLTIVPLCLGMFAQAVFDPKVKTGFWKLAGITIGVTACMLIGLLIAAYEAAICVVMALPIILPSELIGIMIARRLLTRNNDRIGPKTLHASLILLPLLALPLDRTIPFPLASQSLRSEIIINATPAEIWQQTLVIPTIQPDERIWTFSHNILGTPMPISADITGNLRSLSWTKGVRFQEVVTESLPNQRLAWDFNFNDPESLAAFDPHVSPNSEMLRVSDGFYELEALPNGTTRLILETHYQTRSPFNGYLNLWGRLFLQDFHSAVLAVIKSRSESVS